MTNVSVLPRYILTDVPAALRQLANQIESGDVSANRVVVVIEPEGETVDYRAFGEDFTLAHAVGMLTAAQYEILHG